MAAIHDVLGTIHNGADGQRQVALTGGPPKVEFSNFIRQLQCWVVALQELGDAVVAVSDRLLQSTAATVAVNPWVGTGLQQELHNVLMSISRGDLQGCAAIGVLGVDITTLFSQPAPYGLLISLLHDEHYLGKVALVGTLNDVSGVHVPEDGSRVDFRVTSAPPKVKVSGPEEVLIIRTVDLNPGHKGILSLGHVKLGQDALQLRLDAFLGSLGKVFQLRHITVLDKRRQLLFHHALLNIQGVHSHIHSAVGQLALERLQGTTGPTETRTALAHALANETFLRDSDVRGGQEHVPLHSVRAHGGVGHACHHSSLTTEHHTGEGADKEGLTPELLAVICKGTGNFITASADQHN
mmetsp:Transcript_67052/g.119074  ORF Transcript_67052/g.119074 Transcript_67052/m.119074 type:complete len:353 (-) Transcript_67052:776-1834(-)